MIHLDVDNRRINVCSGGGFTIQMEYIKHKDHISKNSAQFALFTQLKGRRGALGNVSDS